MNFKKLTRPGIAALLFANISVFAMEKPIQSAPNFNLTVQNNTDYHFAFKPEEPKNSQQYVIKAHEVKKFSNLELTPWGTASLVNILNFGYGAAKKGPETTKKDLLKIFARVNLDLSANTVSLQGLLNKSMLEAGQLVNKPLYSPKIEISDNPSNEFKITITFEGNEDNKFAGSTIEADINTEPR